jgi:Ca-activated chloride channel homolog
MLTRRVSCVVCTLILLMFFCASGLAQDPAAPSPSQAPEQTAPPPSASPSDQPPVADPSQAPPDADAGTFVIKKEVEEVILHAIVVDQQNHLITNLRRENFSVLEDGKPQQMTSFRHEDVPVALGILVDNSGSMRPKRAKLTEAAVKLVEASRGQDRVFVVNFGENAYLDQDFTSDVGKLKMALDRTDTEGTTALYDAVVASAKHLDQSAPQGKKVLLIITDGQDNVSQETLSDALHQLQTKSGPVVYAIVLRRDANSPRENYQAIQSLCQNTGGTVFLPNNLDEVRDVAETIGRAIRDQYVIGYRSSNNTAPGTYHAIAAKAFDDSGHELRVSTRSGYYAKSPQD